jgi:hypothetical protein
MEEHLPSCFLEKPIGVNAKGYLKTGVARHGETLACIIASRGNG